MHEDRRFPFEKIAKLESPERQAVLPVEPLVALVAGMDPGRIADIGVGSGYFALPLAARLPTARVLGVDVEPRMLEVLAERAGANGCADRIEPVLTPADHPALAEESVDLALVVSVYHELDDRVAYLERLRAALAPGGHVVICDWRHDRGFEEGPPEHHRVAESVARADLQAAGFDGIEAHDLYEAFYVLSANRG